MDWGALGASIPVAAIVSIVTNLVIRKLDRPRAFFVISGMYFAKTLEEMKDSEVTLERRIAYRPPDFMFEVYNAGDSPAHWLHVETKNCSYGFVKRYEDDPRGGRSTQQLGLLQPGESHPLFIWLDKNQTIKDASVRLTWLRTPVRHYRFEQQPINLENIMKIEPPYQLWSHYRPQIKRKK